jgi:CubicO group peptidase (beta-lactamase class C family)
MKKPVIGIFLVFVLALLPLQAMAQERANPQGPTDPAELEAFLDGIMAVHLEANHVAGAVIAVVKDGTLFFAKGYGYADVKTMKPVIADRTLFRPGSVSKLLTWTAVMQLCEQGRIDLDADVNSYLKDFKIPATYPQPITMNHLISHTPGFEERVAGAMARSEADLMPLGRFLATHMPSRVRRPGIFTSYSNYGTMLAGYIVEVVSGMPFPTYIERNIFEPLGMRHSTFREPLPANLLPEMSAGYTYEDGAFKAHGFEFFNGESPAGALSSSATDMAKFMIAHLQNGRFGDRRILKEETSELMHTRLFGHDPRIPGNAHGFWESEFNGLRIIEHGGDTLLFHSQLVLVPEKNLGWFVCFNSPNGSSREQLLAALLDRYYRPSASLAEIKPSPQRKSSATRVVGTYSSARRGYTTYEKLAILLASTKISATDDGAILLRDETLVLPDFSGGAIPRYAEVDPLVFRKVDGQDKIIFKEDERGKIAYALLGKDPSVFLIKLKWYETPLFHKRMLAVCLFLFLTAVLGWPLAALSRKICKRQIEGTRPHPVARWLAGGMSGLLILTALGIASALGQYTDLFLGVPLILKLCQILPILAAALGVGTLIFVFKAWKEVYWTPCQRVHYTLIALASLAFFWFLNYWNLIGWRY